MSRRLGVDIDGVIADQTEAMVRYLSSKYDMSFSTSQLRRGGSYIRAIGSDYTTEMRAAQQENQYYEKMPPVAGALDALRTLSDHFEIVLVTHRPKGTEAVTREWLSRHRIPFDELHLGAPDDKSAVGIDFLIDDRVGNVTGCANAVPLLFLRDHNIELLQDGIWTAAHATQKQAERLVDEPAIQWDAITNLLVNEPAPEAVIRSLL